MDRLVSRLEVRLKLKIVEDMKGLKNLRGEEMQKTQKAVAGYMQQVQGLVDS